MTGVAADADDLVQETFVRALNHPPADVDADLGSWLTRVAVNLARDHLRARRRRGWPDPWLPAPIETPDAEGWPAYEPQSTAGRNDLLESCTFALLLALEALPPQQRAVLLLREVFDYSVLRETNVKVTHHRARRRWRPPTRALQDTTRRTLERFLEALIRGDGHDVEALLAAEVRALNDGGGEFHHLDVDAEGQVHGVFSVLATRKLSAVRFG